tara:strand:+ start:64 stop:777 length:714 start_codon:yes stop_codon:yes gene_type:complete
MIQWLVILSFVFYLVPTWVRGGRYEVLDGAGPSRTKVDVIEFKGKMEIHVYPPEHLLGLGARVEKNSDGEKVMVLSYRLSTTSKPLIRRATLNVPFKAGASVLGFEDSRVRGYKKIYLVDTPMKIGTPYKIDSHFQGSFPDDPSPATTLAKKEESAPFQKEVKEEGWKSQNRVFSEKENEVTKILDAWNQKKKSIELIPQAKQQVSQDGKVLVNPQTGSIRFPEVEGNQVQAIQWKF